MQLLIDRFKIKVDEDIKYAIKYRMARIFFQDIFVDNKYDRA